MTDLPPTNCDQDADDLVVRARVEREAFGKLYDMIYPPVFQYCLRRSGNRSVAEDITSTVFLNVAGSISNFAGATFEEFRRWILRSRPTKSTQIVERQCGEKHFWKKLKMPANFEGMCALKSSTETLNPTR